jgi:hypothetical protein
LGRAGAASPEFTANVARAASPGVASLELTINRKGEKKKKEAGATMIFHRSSLSSKIRNEYFIRHGVHMQI